MSEEAKQKLAVFDDEPSILDGSRKKKSIIAAVAIAVALLSAFVLSGIFSSPATYPKTIGSLDNKKTVVMEMAAASTAASAAVSAIPDDTCTPIAEKLADLSHDFLIILTAIYLEKYLLTTFGFIAFALLVPASCILVIIATFLSGRAVTRRRLTNIAKRLALLGLALVLTVPAGVGVSGLIETTYAEEIDGALSAAQQTTQAAEDAVADSEKNEESAGGDPLTFFQQRLEDIQNAAGGVAETVSGAAEWLQTVLNNLINGFAVLVVTSCVIPLLILVFFLWLVKLIMGVSVDVPMAALSPRSIGRK